MVNATNFGFFHNLQPENVPHLFIFLSMGLDNHLSCTLPIYTTERTPQLGHFNPKNERQHVPSKHRYLLIRPTASEPITHKNGYRN
jgi:hypothetical protein